MNRRSLVSCFRAAFTTLRSLREWARCPRLFGTAVLRPQPRARVRARWRRSLTPSTGLLEPARPLTVPRNWIHAVKHRARAGWAGVHSLVLQSSWNSIPGVCGRVAREERKRLGVAPSVTSSVPGPPPRPLLHERDPHAHTCRFICPLDCSSPRPLFLPSSTAQGPPSLRCLCMDDCLQKARRTLMFRMWSHEAPKQAPISAVPGSSAMRPP